MEEKQDDAEVNREQYSVFHFHTLKSYSSCNRQVFYSES